ncbi:MAG: NADH:flavin oxidoreductase [Dehalococcoidia bacterium]
MKDTPEFPLLFKPGYIGKMETRNRIVMAPMANMYANLDGSYSQRQIDYYAERAKGGAGLIISEVTFVERKISPPADPVAAYIDTNWHIPKASDLVDAAHDYGAKICIQLSPGPGRNMNGMSGDRAPIAASAVPSLSDPNILCRELSVAEIKEIVRACGDAAERAVKAGFDMIEVHGHIGYLIDGFMMSLYNRRTDEYGGNIEGRMRFALEIVSEMRSRVGDDFPLCFRYSGEHKIEGGRTITESQEIARILESAGVDILHIDAGCYEVPYWITPPYYMPQGCLADMAAAIKKAVNIPVITVGGITSPEVAEQILREEKADYIGLGRALIADPAWPDSRFYVKKKPTSSAWEGRSLPILPGPTRPAGDRQEISDPV